MKLPEQANPQRQEVDWWLPGWGGCRVSAGGYRVSFGGDGNVLELDRGGRCTAS